MLFRSSVALPQPPAVGYFLAAPTVMTPIRGYNWGTDNPSGQLEIGKWSAYASGINATWTGAGANFTAYDSQPVLQLMAGAGDTNLFVNITKRAGEKFQVSFDGTPYYPTPASGLSPSALDTVDVYWEIGRAHV